MARQPSQAASSHHGRTAVASDSRADVRESSPASMKPDAFASSAFHSPWSFSSGSTFTLMCSGPRTSVSSSAYLQEREGSHGVLERVPWGVRGGSRGV
jgi:hypothetical protein